MITPLPHPPRKFIVGNLPQIAGKDTMTKMIQLGYDYPFPLLELKVLNIELIFVFSHRLAKELLSQDEKFPKHIDVPVEHLREITGDGLFTAYDNEPNWHKAHNILTPGFAQRSIRGYVPAMKKICDELLDCWAEVPEGDYLNLSAEMTKLTFETIGVCGFDYRFGCFESEQPHDFIPAMLFALEEAITRARMPPFLLPLRFKANALQKKYLAYTDNLIDSIIKKRKENPVGNSSKFDLLSLMLNAKDKATNSKLSDENIRYQIYTFLVAGHETTSGLLSFTFYLLLKNPDWLAKVYEEIDGVWGADDAYNVSHRDLPKFRIIKQVLLETLRLYPSVPMINVAATEATTIGEENYPIAAHKSCLIWTYHLHRDPAVWGENAEEFNPDHFLPENIAKRDPYAFRAFGNGKRACIGRQFAMTEATLAVATILQRYQLEIDPTYKMELDETITLRPKSIHVRLKKRTDNDRYHLEPLAPKEQNVSTPTVAVPAHKTPFLVLYGSNMGSSEDLALQIYKDAKAHGFVAQLAPLDAYVDRLPKEGLVQIVSSTYNGTPPDNAQQFNQWLHSATPDLKGVTYNVFGCGNTQWDTYQVFPNFVDRSLHRLGAQRFYEKGSADASADFEGEFQQWYQGYWKTALENIPTQTTATPASWQVVDGVSNYTPPSHLTYHNEAALVSRALQHFGLTATSFVQYGAAAPVLLKDWLTHQVDLTKTATPAQLQALIDATGCPPDQMKLQAYLQQHTTAIVGANKTVLNLLQEFKACELTLAQFLALL